MTGMKTLLILLVSVTLLPLMVGCTALAHKDVTFEATGLHAVTGMGIIGLGYIHYESSPKTQEVMGKGIPNTEIMGENDVKAAP